MSVKKEIDKKPHDEKLQQKLIEYEQWLLKLGEGKLHSKGTIDDSHSDIVEVPINMCCDTKDAVVKEVFDDFELNIGNAEYFKSRVLLAATNQIVNEVNNELVDKITGNMHTFHGIDTVGDLDNTAM